MTDAEKREKVIKGLEQCVGYEDVDNNYTCIYDGDINPNCPYGGTGEDGESCMTKMMRDALALLKAQEPITGETSDGYHTFNELYHHRAVLFSVIVANYPDRAWKAKKHHDGTMYDGMFIVGIDTPDGQATYHYDIDPYWGMFKCRELDAAPEWDGHTPAQAIERIGRLKAQEPRVMTLYEVAKMQPAVDAAQVVHGKWMEEPDRVGHYHCSKCGVVFGVSARAMKFCPGCGAKMMNSPLWDMEDETDER